MLRQKSAATDEYFLVLVGRPDASSRRVGERISFDRWDRELGGLRKNGFGQWVFGLAFGNAGSSYDLLFIETIG